MKRIAMNTVTLELIDDDSNVLAVVTIPEYQWQRVHYVDYYRVSDRKEFICVHGNEVVQHLELLFGINA